MTFIVQGIMPNADESLEDNEITAIYDVIWRLFAIIFLFGPIINHANPCNVTFKV